MTFDVTDYLAVGFVPFPEKASQYIQSLFGEIVDINIRAPLLLSRLIQEIAYDKGFRNVVIPLSGGLDSRSILGAALQVYEPSAIHCMTVGTEVLHDYVVAARTCKRLGVTHERIDPNALSWDLDRLQELAGAQYVRLGSLIPVDALIMCDAMAARIPAESAVLSGYLGDAISGKHLSPGSHQMTPSMTVDTFVQKNRVDSKFPPSAEVRRTLLEFLEEHGDAIRALPGAAPYDLLDLGFRQFHRIKAVTTWAFSSPLAPYEDPRWVAHWLSRPQEDRLDQSAYRNEMERAFPLVFSEPAPTVPKKRIRRILGGVAEALLSESDFLRVRQLVRAFGEGPVEVHQNRGDPRINASMATAMRCLLDAFDRRGVIEDRVIPRFEALLTSPTLRNATICRWVASAELHIRAGNVPVTEDTPTGRFKQASSR